MAGGVAVRQAILLVALIGTPSETDPWQWQWGGHHVTVNATIVGANISLTPSFIGVQPATYTDANGKTVRPLGDIEDEAFALVNSLDATQQKAAILGSTSIDLVLGPGQDGKTIQSEGLPAAQMTADQQAASLQADRPLHRPGQRRRRGRAHGRGQVRRSTRPTSPGMARPPQGSAAYFRVTGPTIVIEYSPQGDGRQRGRPHPRHLSRPDQRLRSQLHGHRPDVTRFERREYAHRLRHPPTRTYGRRRLLPSLPRSG